MSSVLFTTFYLFLVYYSESLDCKGRKVDYHQFSLHPIIYWMTNTEKPLQRYIKSEILKRLQMATEDFGVQKLFPTDYAHTLEKIRQWGSFNDPQLDTSWDERLQEWGAENFTDRVMPFLINPPKILRPTNIRVYGPFDFVARVNQVDGTTDFVKRDGMYVIKIPLVITDRGPYEFVNNIYHDAVKALGDKYKRSTIVTLAIYLDLPWLPLKFNELVNDPGIQSIHEIWELPKNWDETFKSVEVFRTVLDEVDAYICDASVFMDEADLAASRNLLVSGVGIVVGLLALAAVSCFAYDRYGSTGYMAKLTTEELEWHLPVPPYPQPEEPKSPQCFSRGPVPADCCGPITSPKIRVDPTSP